MSRWPPHLCRSPPGPQRVGGLPLALPGRPAGLPALPSTARQDIPCLALPCLAPALPLSVQLKWWTVDVAFQGRVMGSGGSFDKRDAGQAAARQALQRLGQLPGEA